MNFVVFKSAVGVCRGKSLIELFFEAQNTSLERFKLSLDNDSNVTDNMTDQRSLHHIDRYCLIWFDTERPSERNIRLQANLKSIVNDIFVFQDLAHVEAKIQRLKNHKIFIIFNGSVDKPLIYRVHRRSQVAAIYIYYRRPHRYEHIRPLFPKLKQISNDFGSLCKSLKSDLYVYEKVDNSRLITDSSEVPNENSQNQSNLIRFWESFENTQPLIEAKDIMLNTLRDYYQNNESMVSILNEFEETIRPQTSVNWYTQETLIYRFVNNAFRACDWDLIDKLQYFIHCLCIQLTREHSAFVEKCYDNPIITVYRSQFISNAEFDRLVTQTSNTLFLPCFALTSLQESIALNLINRSEPSSHDIRVLFKITIDTRIKGTQPYADITHLSAHSDEQEVMIMFGAKFRLIDILLNTSRKMPLVLLELCPSREENDANEIDQDDTIDNAESEHPGESGWD